MNDMDVLRIVVGFVLGFGALSIVQGIVWRGRVADRDAALSVARATLNEVERWHGSVPRYRALPPFIYWNVVDAQRIIEKRVTFRTKTLDGSVKRG